METQIQNNRENNSDEQIFNESNYDLHKAKTDTEKFNFLDNNHSNKINTDEASEKLHLSLILDDENKLSLDIDPSENIENICVEICKKNKLDINIAKKLMKKIEEQISILKYEKENYIKIREEQIVSRLYTEAMKHKFMRDKHIEKMKNDMKEKELNKCSFTPKISQKSNLMYNRSHLKIEDKLFYEEMEKKEKRNFERIIKEINEKDHKESKASGNPNKSDYRIKEKSKIKNSLNKNDSNDTKEKYNIINENNNSNNYKRNSDAINKNNFNNALDHMQNGFNRESILLNNSNNLLKNSPQSKIIKKSNFAFHNIKEKNEQNSDYSTNMNILNNLNNNKDHINNLNSNNNFNNLSEKQEFNSNIKNGNNEENKFKTTSKKSIKESPVIFSKKKTQINLNADKDETFSNIINFVNQDLKRGSYGQNNVLNNFVYKHNTGNTYSSLHKNNISYNSAKNQIDSKNLNNKRNSFSNKKIIDNNNNIILNEMSENASELRSGSVEKIDNCFYLRLTRTPNDNDMTKSKDIISPQENVKKDSIFGGESIISNEEYKIVKKSNNNNLNSNMKNGNMMNSNYSLADSDNFLKSNRNLKSRIEAANQENNSNNYYKKANNLISKNTNDRNKNSNSKIIDKKIYKANDLESQYSKEYKSLKEDSNNKKQFKNNFERLYQDANETKRVKEKYIDFIIKRECPFMPQISENSRNLIKSSQRFEDKEEIYKRLSRNKNKQHDLKKSRSKLSNTLNHIANISSKEKENKNSLKNSRNYNSDSEGTRRIRTKITIREQKSENEIYSTIDELNHNTNKLKKTIDRKLKENMGKFKLNNLKEVFEVIFSKCNSIQDIQNLGKFGISSSMKDNVILPTLHMIQERNLEFNFQNFYLAANEIINQVL